MPNGETYHYFLQIAIDIVGRNGYVTWGSAPRLFFCNGLYSLATEELQVCCVDKVRGST